MTLVGLAAAALIAGVLLGGLATWLVLREPAAAPTTFESPEPVVPAGVTSVLEVLNSGGVVVGPHDEVLAATEVARRLGLTRGSRVVVPELLDLVRAVRADAQTRSSELELKRGYQTAALYVVSRVAPLGDGLILILAEDQTAARRIERTRHDFVANVSHELKTPIGAVTLLAEAVAAAADDPDSVRRFASRLEIESARLSELVKQIIDLSRLQADDPLAKSKTVDVDAVLADAVDRSRVEADGRQVTLTLATPTGAQVLGNRRQLRIAVGNLVENAVLYSDPGARVVVAAHTLARSDDDWVELTVSDSGIGIPTEEQDRIFERFYRVDYARSRANGGTGLGLSIVKHIAATHGGEVAVWSRPGQGSTFTIRIPAHVQPPDPNHQEDPR